MWFAKSIENHSNKVEVRYLIVAAEIINSSRLALEKRGDNSAAMIVHVDPIAHIHAVAIHRERLLAERLDNHERD